MALSIMGLLEALSITVSSVIMLNIIMLNVIRLSVAFFIVMLSVVVLHDVVLHVVMLHVVMLHVVIESHGTAVFWVSSQTYIKCQNMFKFLQGKYALAYFLSYQCRKKSFITSTPSRLWAELRTEKNWFIKLKIARFSTKILFGNDLPYWICQGSFTSPISSYNLALRLNSLSI